MNTTKDNELKDSENEDKMNVVTSTNEWQLNCQENISIAAQWWKDIGNTKNMADSLGDRLGRPHMEKQLVYNS